jgi:hypothetical protein
VVGEQRPERRKNPRFVLGKGTKGRTSAVDEVSLVNLSLGGAMIEHATVVQPDTISALDLELQQKTFSLRCRIVWSQVDRQGLDPEGKEVTIYRTGLEFFDPPDEIQRVISDYVQWIIEEKESMLPDEG